MTEPDPEGATAEPAEVPYPRPRLAWYMVGVLLLIYVFSFIDRQILALLVGPIRSDLNISDTQISYLMGFSFALFYTFFGIPIGRIADTGNRRKIIAVGLVVWSLMTAACGLAQRFWHFLLLRVGVGIGEAALSPAAYSMITDSFPKRKLATAISVYSTGIYIGAGLASVVGGVVVGMVSNKEDMIVPVVGTIHPWQIVFFIVGLPGLLVATLLYTFKEPLRRAVKRDASGKVQAVPFGQVLGYIGKNWKTMACHNLGFAMLSFSSYGSGAWIPEFLQRTHDYTATRAGVTYGIIVMVFGTLGVYCGGVLADWLAERGYRDAKMRAGLIAAVVWAPVGLVYPLVGNSTLTMVLIAPSVFCACMPFGCAPAAIQEMMPNTMRGQASAIYLFVVNIIGLGFGISAVAWCTDYLFQDDASLRYSLLVVSAAAHLLAALLLWSGLAPFRKSMDRLKVWMAAQAA